MKEVVGVYIHIYSCGKSGILKEELAKWNEPGRILGCIRVVVLLLP